MVIAATDVMMLQEFSNSQVKRETVGKWIATVREQRGAVYVVALICYNNSYKNLHININILRYYL